MQTIDTLSVSCFRTFFKLLYCLVDTGINISHTISWIHLTTFILHSYYRSDVLGQFMPMVGVDWSQTGVAHLFSAIKVCCISSYVLVIAKSSSHVYHLREYFVLQFYSLVHTDSLMDMSPQSLLLNWHFYLKNYSFLAHSQIIIQFGAWSRS